VFSSVAIYLAYVLVDANDGFELRDNWKANIEKCSGKTVTEITKLDVYQGNIFQAGTIILALSAYLGVLFKNKFVRINQKPSRLYRCGGILIKLLFIAPVLYLSSSYKSKDIFFLFLTKTFLPTLYGSFILFSGIDEIILSSSYKGEVNINVNIELKG